MPPRRRKTLLVEDHALVRESMLLLLSQRLPGHSWREGATLRQALDCLQREPDVDLLLLDLNLADSRGLATLDQVRDAAPQVPVVVVSADDAHDNVLAAIGRGAAGFLSKTVDAEQFVAAVQRMMLGGVVVPSAIAGAKPASDGTPELSERQRDVLRLLIEGKANKVIGRELGLSEATVKTHLQAVYRALDVENRTQAVLAAARWWLML